MATAVFNCITAHSTFGVFSVDLTYDTSSLQITNVHIVNSTRNAHALTIGSRQFVISDGTDTNVNLTPFSQFMVSTGRGPRPPVFVG